MNSKTAWVTVSPTEVRTTDVEGIGSLRVWEGTTPGKIYRWVKNPTTNVSFAIGHVVCHKFSDGANAEKYIYKPATADLSYLAGVCLTTISSNTGTNPSVYGWIQVFGYNASICVSNTTNATINTGDYLKGVNAALYLTRDTTSPPTYRRTIQAISQIASGETPASTTSCAGFIHCF